GDRLPLLRRRQRSLCGSQTGYRHTERRAAHVVEPQRVAELHRVWLSAVLTADAQLDVLARLTALLDRNAHEGTHTALVDRRERVLLDDLFLLVGREERARVVTRHAERRLREVVGAETEELGRLRNLVGR